MAMSPMQGSQAMPLADAQAAMQGFLPQKAMGGPMAGAGGMATGLDQQPMGTTPGKTPGAMPVPGLPGRNASNPIAKHGPLGPPGVLDGNHASGAAKGGKIGSRLQQAG